MILPFDINPVTTLAAVRAGHTSRGDLEDYFDVAPGNDFLRRALGDLEYHGHISRDRMTDIITTEETR